VPPIGSVDDSDDLEDECRTIGQEKEKGSPRSSGSMYSLERFTGDFLIEIRLSRDDTPIELIRSLCFVSE
jgi:hypothetical protein